MVSATTDLQTERTRPRAGSPTTIGRPVELACPLCGQDRTGRHVRPTDAAADAWVECDECGYRCDVGVLDIPTESALAGMRAQAIRHAAAALRSADGTPSGSYLAVVWCRRLAPELSHWGKRSFLDGIVGPMGRPLTLAQRAVVVDLGVALRLDAAAINACLDPD